MVQVLCFRVCCRHTWPITSPCTGVRRKPDSLVASQYLGVINIAVYQFAESFVFQSPVPGWIL